MNKFGTSGSFFQPKSVNFESKAEDGLYLKSQLKPQTNFPSRFQTEKTEDQLLDDKLEERH